MVGRRNHTIAVLLIALPIALAACDNNGGVRANVRGELVGSPTVTFGSALIAPQFIGLQPFVGFNCPFVAPFFTNLDLIIDARAGFDLFLNRVTFDFFDRSGLRGSPLLVSADDINARFRDTVIRGGTTRAFGFRPQFGCGLGIPARIVAQVFVLDATGRLREMSASASIK